MPKGKSKFDFLPLHIRHGIYARILGGQRFPAIIDWLFAQANDNEDGQLCAEIWKREAKSDDAAKHNATQKLYELRASEEYLVYRAEALKQSDLRRLNDDIEAKIAAGGKSADQTLMNVVMFYVERIIDGSATPKDVKSLVDSWAGLRGLERNDVLTEAARAKLTAAAATAKTEAAKPETDPEKMRATVLAMVDEAMGIKPKKAA
jgi:hypothetical protein